MIHILETSQYSQVRPLFRHLAQTQPMCAAVLAGAYPGKIFVDDLVQPRSALLTTFIESEAYGVWGFLAGDAHNAAFNQALNAAIFERRVIGRDTPALLLTCDPQDWGGQMDAVLAPRPPIWTSRYHFVGRNAGRSERAALPEGFALEPMTDALLQMPGLPEDVAATLEKWRGMAGERFADYGFVVVDRSGPQPVLASWATVDFVADGAGDLGFFTQPDYRKRGLGTIAVSAALEHGFANGLQQINWTCEADNEGSLRTAEKLGLEKLGEYPMAWLFLDEQRHLSLLNA
ncbi:MAG: GNAT family N-acetyltransferase [Chloroflexota bacterium]